MSDVFSQNRPKEYMYAIIIYDENPLDTIKSKLFFIYGASQPQEVQISELYKDWHPDRAIEVNNILELYLVFNSSVLEYSTMGWEFKSSVQQGKNITVHTFER